MTNLAVKYLERRAFGRRECTIEAVAVVGRSHHDIIIRNFSESGALVEFPEGVDVPEKFTIRLVTHKLESRCEVRHRKHNRVGVEFVTGSVGVRLERDYQQQLARARIVAAPSVLPQRHSYLKLVPATGTELRRNLMSQINPTAPMPSPAIAQNVAVREGHMSKPQSDAENENGSPVADDAVSAAEASNAEQSEKSEAAHEPPKLKIVQPEPLLLPV